MQENIAKKIALEYLAFLRYKIKNDLLTMEEIESLARMFEENLIVTGTVDDLARFHGQTRKNVYTVIERHMVEKPVRKVLYSFSAFRKARPSSWKFRSNNTELLMRWFPEATPQENDMRFVELAINFLKDPDSPFDGSIIWDYLSGKKKVA